MTQKITSLPVDPIPPDPNRTADEERNWTPIYVAVLIYTGLLIAGLALFSRGI